MTSLILEPTDGRPLAPGLPGQFIALRLRPEPDLPALLRSYSLSGEPSEDRYRVSVRREAHGAAGAYIEAEVRVGDMVEVSAPRGSFTLKPGDGPVVLLSAGVGATPVLAMLHALAAGASPREIWWVHGARSGDEHPFAAETRALLEALPHGHSHVRYSAPDLADRLGIDFDAPGRLDARVLQELGLPPGADFYLCGPPAFMSDLTVGPGCLGYRCQPHSHRALRVGAGHDAGHCRSAAPRAAFAARAYRRGAGDIVCAERPQRALGFEVS